MACLKRRLAKQVPGLFLEHDSAENMKFMANRLKSRKKAMHIVMSCGIGELTEFSEFALSKENQEHACFKMWHH